MKLTPVEKSKNICFKDLKLNSFFKNYSENKIYKKMEEKRISEKEPIYSRSINAIELNSAIFQFFPENEIVFPIEITEIKYIEL